MSEFASNFLTYLTATAFGGVCLIAGLELDRAADPAVTVVARTMPAETALPSRADSREYQEAVLEAVVFTAAGIDQTPSFEAEDTRPRGRVTGRSVNLREGPGTNFTIAGRAGGGDELIMTGQRDGIWYEVISPVVDRRVWIHGNFFEAPEAATALARN